MAISVENRPSTPMWRLDWLSPARCRALLAAILVFGAASHLIYLHRDCPIDLSGDEAQYWDWSRNLDLSYYSKGPLVAYIIRASCALFGNTMQAVRYPALLLGIGTSIITYLLANKLFRSERLALGAVMLNHLVPMFVAGSVLMTIDPPLFFCWACATYFAAIAIEDDRLWAWVVAGLFVGLGFLAKYAMFLWLPSLLVFILVDRKTLGRERSVRWGGPLIATLIAMIFTLPVIVWNQRHGWVSFRHVAQQTGASGGSFQNGNFFEFIGAQIGVVGPILTALIACGIGYAIKHRNEQFARQARFLICIGLPFFLFTMLASFLAKVQVNWPAPAYFSLLILAAYFISTRLRSIELWRPWSGWIYGTIVIGLISMPIVHDISILFPLFKLVHIDPAKADYMEKLRGWAMLGREVSDESKSLPNDSFILCDDYMLTAEMAFYVDGQPQTYCAGPYYESNPKRLSQYDMWPDRSLLPTVDGQPNKLLHRDAIFVGKGGPVPAEIAQAFDHLEKLPEIPVIVRGVEVHSFKIWRCFGFKGMFKPSDSRNF